MSLPCLLLLCQVLPEGIHGGGKETLPSNKKPTAAGASPAIAAASASLAPHGAGELALLPSGRTFGNVCVEVRELSLGGCDLMGGLSRSLSIAGREGGGGGYVGTVLFVLRERYWFDTKA